MHAWQARTQSTQDFVGFPPGHTSDLEGMRDVATVGAEQLDGRRIAVTGGTGFLGTALIALVPPLATGLPALLARP